MSITKVDALGEQRYWHIISGRTCHSDRDSFLLQMSSAGDSGDAAPAKQNEEKTYKKVSECLIFSSQFGKNVSIVRGSCT